jgi:hypothetical protein
MKVIIWIKIVLKITNKTNNYALLFMPLSAAMQAMFTFPVAALVSSRSVIQDRFHPQTQRTTVRQQATLYR